MRRKLVIVEWVDSHSIDGWRTIEDMKPDGICRCQTVGWLMRKDKELVSVVQSLAFDGRDSNATTNIPTGSVKRIRELIPSGRRQNGKKR